MITMFVRALHTTKVHIKTVNPANGACTHQNFALVLTEIFHLFTTSDQREQKPKAVHTITKILHCMYVKKTTLFIFKFQKLHDFVQR